MSGSPVGLLVQDEFVLIPEVPTTRVATIDIHLHDRKYGKVLKRSK